MKMKKDKLIVTIYKIIQQYKNNKIKTFNNNNNHNNNIYNIKNNNKSIKFKTIKDFTMIVLINLN